nr:MAG TPA: Protein of unknown function (DUF2829) [Caudoviricetes sp.]
MRFSTAFEHMLNGKAIRRYHWKPESCLNPQEDEDEI